MSLSRVSIRKYSNSMRPSLFWGEGWGKWLAQGQDPERFVNKMIKPSEDYDEIDMHFEESAFSVVAHMNYTTIM